MMQKKKKKKLSGHKTSHFKIKIDVFSKICFSKCLFVSLKFKRLQILNVMSIIVLCFFSFNISSVFLCQMSNLLEII